MSYPSINVMGYDVYSKTPEDIRFTERKTVISTLNAYSYVIAKKDNEFRESLQSSDILIADGFPVVVAAKILNNQNIRKIAGYDIFHYLLQQLNKNAGSCFFLGASEETLEKIRIKLNSEFPRIKAHFFSPPFKQEFSKRDNEIMIEKINEIKPDVLFVGMTAPKQEKWVHNNKAHINADIICSIGAVFDFYAGTVNRPSEFWISLGLEWFIRFVKEPKRLWKRYFIYSPVFFIDLLLYKTRLKRGT